MAIMAGSDLIFHHGQTYDDYRFYVDKTFPDYYALQFMSSGTVKVGYDDEQDELTGSWIWPCFPGPRIHFEPGSSGAWAHQYIAFSGSRIQTWQSQGLWFQRPQEINNQQRCMAEFTELIACSQRSDYWGQRRARHILEGILLQLAEERSQQEQRYEAWLEDFLRRLHAQKYRNIDTQAIADSWGMALSTFRRRFQKIIGSSVHDYQLMQRMQLAKEYLQDPERSIKSIAHELGFSDVYYFSRQFKQRIGISPGAYRKQV